MAYVFKPEPTISRRQQKLARSTIKDIIQEETRPEPILTLSKNIIRKRPVRSSIISLSFLILTASCLYQITDRFLYFNKQPTSVTTHFNQDDFLPKVMVTLALPDTLREYMFPNETQFNGRCYSYPLAQTRDINHFLFLWQNPSFVKNAYYIQGKSRSNLTLKTPDRFIEFPMTEIYYDQVVSFAESKPSIQFTISAKEPCNMYSRFFVVPNTSNKTNTDFLREIYSNLIELKHLEMFISIKKYYLLAAKPNHCNPNFDQCILDCLLQTRQESITCYMPIPKFRNLPECKNKSLIYEQFLILKYSKYFNVGKCNCLKPCEITILSQTEDYTKKTDRKTFEFHFEQSRVLKEHFIYDSISLLCDIGGILGLFFGLSILNIAQIMSYHSQRFKTTNVKRKRLHKKLLKLITNETKSKTVILKKLIILVLITSSIYPIYDRIINYFNSPVIITISMTNDIKYPVVYMCKEGWTIAQEKQKMAQHLNISCEHVKFLHLLDPPSIFHGNVTLLWNKTHSVNEYIKPGIIAEYDDITTPFGNCIKIKHMDKLNVSIMYYLGFTFPCEDKISVYVIPEGKLIDIKHRVPLFDAHLEFYMFQTKIIRINRKSDPCMTPQESQVCESKCNDKILEELKPKCRLPFMNINQPFCLNSSTAQEINDLYLGKLYNLNYKADCGCIQVCEETIYTKIKEIRTDSSVLLALRIIVLDEMSELFKQELAVNLVKLMSDIGSILGLSLGYSFFTLYTIFA